VTAAAATGSQGVAPSFGVQVSSIDLHDAGEVEQAVTAFARAPNGSLILTGPGSGARRIAKLKTQKTLIPGRGEEALP
jgi:ABC-type nitrate/sulfonate/bicarbonate transport system substrate-binding protein